MTGRSSFDIVVIGSGPAGHKAAIQGAKAGRTVLVVERDQGVGGSCVQRGTIPSKTLRETAVALTGFRRRSGQVFDITMREDLRVASLLVRMEQVIGAHERYMGDQLERNGVERWHGRAQFVSPHELEVTAPNGTIRAARGETVVIAVGSRPRTPGNIIVDHEHVLDSDSILSMTYLPRSLIVLGAGVIASEYASIFGHLGVQVTMIDRGPRPLGFFDPELTELFLRTFEKSNGKYLGERSIERVEWDGVDSVVTTLTSGEVLTSEKVLFALGRVANLDGLHIEQAGLRANSHGILEVDAHCRTAVPHIYAAGDVIGAPSLASTSMEQGRRAVCHALGIETGSRPELSPNGVYTIPELSTVGISEQEATTRYGGVIVGRAAFHELARGQISAIEDGLLKLVSDASGRKILGIHIVGEGAAELIHIGQVAMLAGWEVDAFVENIFNFPTLAEAYRVAALDVAKKRPRF